MTYTIIINGQAYEAKDVTIICNYVWIEDTNELCRILEEEENNFKNIMLLIKDRKMYRIIHLYYMNNAAEAFHNIANAQKGMLDLNNSQYLDVKAEYKELFENAEKFSNEVYRRYPKEN